MADAEDFPTTLTTQVRAEPSANGPATRKHVRTKPVQGRSQTFSSDSCWVYVMQAGKFIKIGIAADVERRLINIRSGPLETQLVAKRRLANRSMALEAEKAIHRILAKNRHRREWFIVSSDRARRVMARACAKVRLASALETAKPLKGTISLRELLSPSLPRAMKGKSALEQWQWRRARAEAYYQAIETGSLELA